MPLVAIGANLPQSGFTRVLFSVLRRLGAYDIHFVGMGYHGPPISTEGLTIHPCNLRGGDVFGAYQGRDLVRELARGGQAPLVWLLHDLWILKNYVDALTPLRDELGARIAMYVPLDGRLPDPSWLAPFEAIDRIVAYTQFGRDEIAGAMAQLTANGARFACETVDVIPHGVDTETFRPLASSIEAQTTAGGRREARQRLWPDRPELASAFIVLNANRPVPRKRIDLTIDGFGRFAQGKPPGVVLCLHHAIVNDAERTQLRAWIEAAGLRDRVIFSAEGPDAEGGTSDARLNLIYNACDVGINTAMGEGWGLVSVEHGATGAAQVVPRHSACAEIWGSDAGDVGGAEAGEADAGGADAGVFVDVVERLVPQFSPLELAAVSADGVARALDALYADRAYLRTMSRAAHEAATRPAYTWGAIAHQWDDLFRVLSATGGRTAWASQ